LNAAAVILAHNHPSGMAEPSSADQDITVKIKDALKVFDIDVLDHLIVTKEDVCSFATRGLM
jgi:DNA repair protein RadC